MHAKFYLENLQERDHFGRCMHGQDDDNEIDLKLVLKMWAEFIWVWEKVKLDVGVTVVTNFLGLIEAREFLD
jgi:hypothetical protein